MSDKKAESSKKENRTQVQYEKPSIKTENLTAVAAVCNGTTTGGRKATTPTCIAGKLKS